MNDLNLNQAIGRLGDLFEDGRLQASIAPTEFVNQVIDEIISLRSRAEAAAAELRACSDELATREMCDRDELNAMYVELAEQRARADRMEKQAGLWARSATEAGAKFDAAHASARAWKASAKQWRRAARADLSITGRLLTDSRITALINQTNLQIGVASEIDAANLARDLARAKARRAEQELIRLIGYQATEQLLGSASQAEQDAISRLITAAGGK